MNSRCGLVLGPCEKIPQRRLGRFYVDKIGDAVATRDLMADLRAYGVRGGPPPFGPKDRSRFLEALERIVRAAKQGRAAASGPRP